MNAKIFRLMNLLVISAIVLSACSTPTPQAVVVATTPPPATQTLAVATPRNVTVLIGSGKDQALLAWFFPNTLRVRTGDTVTFKLNSDDIHTVTFPGATPPPDFVIPAPGSPPPGPGTPPTLIFNPQVFDEVKPSGPYDGKAYVNSGILNRVADLFAAPLKDSWSMTFAKPGLYQFQCMVHPFMQGTIEVVDQSVADVPSPDAISAQAQKTIDESSKLQDNAKNDPQNVREVTEPGLNNSTVHFVQAGFVDLETGSPATEYLDFSPKTLTIKAGDSVVWTTQGAHTVTFNPEPPDPKIETAKQQGDKTFYFVNLRVAGASNPSATFDQTKYFNSGRIGTGKNRSGWLLTFDKPGTYDYFCALHKPLGMKGTIIVQPR